MLDTGRTVSDFPGLRGVNGRSAEGDPGRMRAIPIVSRGVGGCIPGTQPEAERIRRMTRQGL